jgi:Do/DeqQ family serine protease
MKKYFIFTALALVAGLAGSYAKDWLSPPSPAENFISFPEGPPTTRASFLPGSTQGMAELNESFISASALTTESVVYIKTVSEQESSSWMDIFFGGGGTQQVLSSGSGVILREDGYVVTNNHVIDRAINIEVIFRRRSYKAQLVGTDPSSDLAVLKIEGSKFPAIRTGSSRNLSVGEWVLAVGNPFNLESTVTAGIVSAKGRDIDILKNEFPMESFIQTDAAINPGNSGGALVNLRGELVGINTAILSRTGSYAGYGFAVPVDVVKKIVNDLISYGRVQKSFIGAETEDPDPNSEEGVQGVVLTHVIPGGPADKAGLKPGDIITQIDGRTITGTSIFDEEISLHSPGTTIKVVASREGKAVSAEVLLTNEEGTTDIVRNRAVRNNSLGADFEAISKVERDLYGLTSGVRVTNIRGGMLSRIGIQDGFIITSINNNAVATTEDAIDLLENTRGRVLVQGVSKNGSNGYYSYYY